MSRATAPACYALNAIRHLLFGTAKVKPILMTALALIFCSSAHAEFLDRVELKPALTSGFISNHLNTKRKYNEENVGVGYRFGKYDVMVGTYRNSVNRTSVYAGYEARWKLVENFQVGLLAGGVTGYSEAAVKPFVLPELVLDFRGVELATSYVPRVGKSPAVVAGQLRWAW